MNDITRDKLIALVARVKRVRKWLVLLAALKVAACSLIFVSLYIGVYAWLDHKVNFGQSGRLIALVLLICGAVALLFPLARFLIRHMSCSQAANYIERSRTFDQQLVAAVEYHENEDNYPYSRRLAERLVLQTAKDTAEFDFDWTVPKWQAYAFSAVVLVGLSVAGFFLHDNYVFFSSYFTRLVKPTAAIAPLPPTRLESITTDIRVDPGTVVTLAASIKGEVPEQGAFILTDADPNKEDDTEPLEALRLRPVLTDHGDPKFELSIPIENAGKYNYRFEADDAVSPSHEILVCNIPKINKMTASVRPPNSRTAQTYKEEIEDHTIEVTEDSVVTLHIEASEPLQKVQVSDPEGKKTAFKPANTTDFDFTFTADKEGFVEFAVTSSEGVENSDIPALQVLVKRDEPPAFELLSPGGDYMATNVASVPVKFEVTDDFGLNSATVHFEIAGRPPMSAVFPIKRGSKNQILSCNLEMEEYNLGIGDSIIMYAEAADIDIATEAVKHTATSDLYFIEIRPYRQIWHQIPPPPPPPPGMPPNNEPREAFELLIRILEYTRAIVKKTWTIANKPEKMAPDTLSSDEPVGFTNLERSRLDSIRKDVVYCREQLEHYVDRLGEAAKPTVEKILQDYDDAGSLLASYNAKSALVHEKDAYRLLRILVLELHKALLEMGGGSPKLRDRVVMDEKVHLTRYEKERIEWELQQLADRLDQARRQQERIRDEFENFLTKQDKPQLPAQKVTDERSWTSKEFWPEPTGEPESQSDQPQGKPSSTESAPSLQGGLKPLIPTPPSPGSGVGQTGGEGQALKSGQPQTPQQQKRDTGDYNKSDSKKETQGENAEEGDEQNQPGKGQQGTSNAETQGTGSQGTGQQGEGSDGQGKGNAASKEERMKILSAKQKSLQQRIAQLQQQLRDLPEVSKADKAARKEANRRLDAAQAKMDEFQDRVEQAYYEPGSGNGNLDLALLALELAAQELELARSALEGDIVMTTGDFDPLQVEELAEELAELADALDRTLSPAESAQMLARLQQANALLEAMSPNRNNTTQGSPPNRGQGSGNTSGPAPGGASERLGQTPGVTTTGAAAPADEARALARKFWSMAIKAKRQQGRFIDDEPSDARFYEKENDFFEEAAKAGPETNKK